ncbi:hypothetical protein DSL72_007453 [Monilinia vaccinii-corymbosi]|uniref:DNA polymerase delta subunit 4 n=1 Tax=Monilinia vaccinii-corymbosi TaxID=61207 RepID=A0A8A3PLN1_9HELO|nr:hypothetical protein DSL72_007453 [Monilinia vaccinii-corymbosi]
MPTLNRRRTSQKGSSSSSTQKTLPFTNSTKISKPSTPSTLKSKSKSESQSKSKSTPTNPSQPISPSPNEIITPSTLQTLPGHPKIQSQSQPATPPKTTLTPTTSTSLADHPHHQTHHTLATHLTPSKLRQYWRSREKLRLAPRVHQKHLQMSEKILREWDCMSQFGPAIGIPRTQRWYRASKLGLNPPIEVLAVLLQAEARDGEGEGEGKEAVERAYVDELMN